MQFYSPQDPRQLKKEREKARELKRSSWWQSKLSDGTCYYCEQRFDGSDLTMDHKVPLARGGKSSKSNIVACCKDCNTKKGASTAVDQVLSEVPKMRSVSSDF